MGPKGRGVQCRKERNGLRRLQRRVQGEAGVNIDQIIKGRGPWPNCSRFRWADNCKKVSISIEAQSLAPAATQEHLHPAPLIHPIVIH